MSSVDPKCPWCDQKFKTNGSLGRQYDLWVYSMDPRGPDQHHTQEAIREMNRIREPNGESLLVSL